MNFIDKATEIGGALYLMGIHLKVAHTLIKNPGRYADLMTFLPNKEPTFKRTKSLKDLLDILYVKKANTCPSGQPKNIASFK